jgi:Ion channel
MMTNDDPDPPLAALSPVTASMRRLFAFAKWLSPMQWLGRRYSLFRPRSELTQEEIQSKEFTRRRALAIERYMVAWLGLELVLVMVSCLGIWPTWIGLIFGIVVASRIIEVIQVTVNATLFDALSGRPDERVASRARMIVLAGVNFVELLLCFGLIYAADYASLRGAGRPVTAFYFSIITQLTIGYGDVYPTGWLRVVAATQGLVGILFVILVFGRFMASLPQVHGIFGDKRQ